MSRGQVGVVTYADGCKNDPWLLKTPSLSSECKAWPDEILNPPALAVQVGVTVLSYRLECIKVLRAMLK